MVTINGTSLDAAGQTVSKYLSAASYDPRRVAVERNGAIIPKAQYEKTVFAEGDIIEIVSFVGGG